MAHPSRRRGALIIAGEAAAVAALAIILVRTVDIRALAAAVARLTPLAAAGIIACQLLIVALATWCWWVLLVGAGLARPWRYALRANLASVAVSYLTPSFLCGGVPVRAMLYRGEGMRIERVAAVIAVDTFLHIAGKIPTTIAGAAALVVGARPSVAVTVLLAAIIPSLGILAALLGVLRGGGAVRAVARVASRVLAAWHRPTALRLRSGARRFAGQLDQVGGRGAAIRAALAISVLAALVDVMESWLLVSTLGAGSLTGALAVQANVLVQGISAVIPGNVGGMEAINALTFGLMGMPPSTGVAYSLLARIGQLSIVVLGLGVLAVNAASAVRSRFSVEAEGRVHVRHEKEGVRAHA